MGRRIETVSAKPKGSKAETDEAFLIKAKERYTRAKEYWNERWNKAKDAHKFYNGEQWSEMAKRTRHVGTPQERPMLTINRLPQFHNQIVNDYRQSTIGMKAIPQGDDHIPTAETYEGLFRQIEKQSFAQTAYIKGISDASIGGIGFLEVTTDYVNEKSFDQDIFIKRATSPFVHFPDPDAKEFFLQDAEFWFKLQKCSEDAHKEYGKDDCSSFDSYDGEEDDGEKDIVLAQYWYFTYTKKQLVQFTDGSTAFDDEINKDHKLYDEKHVKNRRDVRVRELKWALLDGTNVLDRKDWPKPRIPIVPIWGNETWVDDKRVLTGFVENAKDSCRVYNYMQSAKVEAIGLAPKAPYIVEEGQLEGHEEDWGNAASTPKAYLKYKAVALDGHIIGAPQRNSYEANIQAIIHAGAQASDDMKATIGMYDASLGQKSNETSGKAITERKREGDVATYNFVDNLALSVGYLGLIVGELIPVYYDAERQVRIVGKMGEVKTVTINKTDPNGKPDPASPQMVDIQHDLVLDTGPSFQTQREETANTIVELSHQCPELMKLAGDIAIGNMNFTGAQEIAARLKRTLPPNVVGEDADPETKLAAAQTQLEQGKKVVEELTGKVAELSHENDLMKVQMKDKTGEINIKQQEIDIKRKEVEAKLATLAKDDKKGDVTHEGLAAVAEAIISLGSELETVKDMIIAAVDHGEGAPATAPSGDTGAAPSDTAAAPEGA